MPTAPTRDDVRAYIGTNGTYTDDQIDTALAAEIAAQARVVRLPIDPATPTAKTLTVGSANAGAGSYWGNEAYVEFVTVTATVTGTVTESPEFTIDGVASNDLGATVWNASEVPGLDDTVYPADVGWYPGGLPFEVTAGNEYSISFECYSAASHIGLVANFGALLAAFTGGSLPYPADLQEALLRRVQRLLEMRSKPLGYQDTMTEFGPSSSRIGPDPEIRRLEAPYRKLVLG